MNRKFSTFLRYARKDRASALVVSLVFIILITILIVGFATTAGLERKTVQSHYAKVQADLFAGMGVDVAASRIQQAMSQGGWALSQPGRLAYGPTNSTTVTFVPLISGTTTTVTPDVSVDMNPKALLASGSIITGDTTNRMPAKWIYVRKDGTQIIDPVAAPAYDANNPLIGRYAFWVDDLSARVNLNTALTTFSGSNPPASLPSRLSLEALGGTNGLSAADITALRTYRTNALFESPLQAKAARPGSPTLAAALDTHKMDVTQYSHSPDLNVFGEPKIVLTTQKSRANGQPFFDILTTDNTDPGVNGNVSASKFNALFNKLLNDYFRRTDWPLMPGKSFVQKYGATTAAQIVLNLIDYVRSAEANNVLVEPSRGHFDGGSIFTYGSAGPTIIGNTRRLYITQMGVWISDEPAPLNLKFYTEVFLPPSAGDRGVPGYPDTIEDLLAGDRQIIHHIGVGGAAITGDGLSINASINLKGDIIADGITGGRANRARMKPGDFRTILIDYSNISRTTRPSGNLDIRSTIRMAGAPAASVDFAPLPFDYSPGAMVTYPLNPPGIAANVARQSINTVEVDDPVINKASADWVQSVNTLGANGKTKTSRSTLGQGRLGSTPQQDTDASGNLTDMGFGFPAVKGSSRNPHGMVESIGELGRIHTGGQGTTAGSIPWRTLRIQPKVSSDTTLPDWAILNLFTVPAEARGVASLTSRDAAVLQIATGTVAYSGSNAATFAAGGRINVNSAIYPFNTGTSAILRTAPLEAVFSSTFSGTLAVTANPSAAAVNVSRGTLASSGRKYGPSDLQTNNLYMVPEQIAEILGVADWGEESEVAFRTALPFLTTRGSTFSVFAVGQKITQTRNGDIRVVGQSRNTALLEWRDGTVHVVSTQEPW